MAASIQDSIQQIQIERPIHNIDIDLTASVFRLASVASISKPYLKHPEVCNAIDYFTKKPGLRFIQESLERAQPYIPYILEKLENYNLPYELVYLPILESGYRLHAVSRSKAVGPWQFMYDSALPYGLVINNYRDDRRDIIAATDAALRKIRAEFNKTGDLWLAIAAYNAGLTRIMRAKQKLEVQGMKGNFWTMLDQNILPKETMAYVPKFIAITHIIKEILHFSPNALRENKENKSIILIKSPGKISLDVLADNIGVDQFHLNTLNAGLIRGYTPPSNVQYYIKIPAHSEEAAKEYLASYVPPQPKSSPIVRKATPKPVVQKMVRKPTPKKTTRVYVVRKGDTIMKISRRYGIKVTKIIYANPGIKPNKIYPGQKLRLP